MKRTFLIIAFMAASLAARCQWTCGVYDTGFNIAKVAETNAGSYNIRIINDHLSSDPIICISGNGFYPDSYEGDMSADIKLTVDGKTQTYYSYGYVDNGGYTFNICMIENADAFWESVRESSRIRFVIHNVKAPAVYVSMKSGNIEDAYQFISR